MAYYGLLGPWGLPKEIVGKVHAAATKTLADPLVRKFIEELGAEVIGGKPEQFASQIRPELTSNQAVVTSRHLLFD